MSKRVLVTGAAGFVGFHLCKRLKAEGHWVRGVDNRRPNEFGDKLDVDEFHLRDLRYPTDAMLALDGVKPFDAVFNLAADMGGIGYISGNRATISRNNTRINLSMLESARINQVPDFIFSSSACVYPVTQQDKPDSPALVEDMAWPANPEPGYGLEKLYAEELCTYYREEFDLNTQIVRFHNVAGPCFDDQTEALTRTGWKKFENLSDDDEIATLNPDSGLLEYHCPLARQIHDYSGPMYRVDHRAADLLVTPDHSIYYAFRTMNAAKESHVSEFRRGAAKESGWDRARMYFSCHAKWTGVDSEFMDIPEMFMKDGRSMRGMGGGPKRIPMDLWLEFVGWYISEGSSWITPSNHTVCITQNPGPKQDAIVACIQAMGYNCNVAENIEHVRNQVIVSSKQLYEAVQVFGHWAENKTIPREYLELPPHRLRVLWRSMMDGDGDADDSRYTTVSKALADRTMELILKTGRRAWISEEQPNAENEKLKYRIHQSRFTRLDTRRKHRTIEQYTGKVYDVTVPNHILMVRRNGKAMWSGNCGTYKGGREKAPAAACRKVIEAADNGTVSIWGDGLQRRSFMYVDDCVEGLLRLWENGWPLPINLGTSEDISIKELHELAAVIAGKNIKFEYDLTKPQGVRGRNSDNTLIKQVLNWEPSTPIAEWLPVQYRWIEAQIRKNS